VVISAAAAYRTGMREFARQTNLEAWYAQLDIVALLDRWRAGLAPAQVKGSKAAPAKARTRDSLQSLDKLTRVVDGHRRIRGLPPMVVPGRGSVAGRRGGGDLPADADPDPRIQPVACNRPQAPARTVPDRAHGAQSLGVGSVGTRAWILLMLGRDDADPLFLQAKEAQASVLEHYAGVSEHAHHGEPVVAGQRLMQASGDIFLGTHRVRGVDGQDRDFYVRQLRDWKRSAVVRLHLRLDLGAPACTLGRPHRDRRVPRVQRSLRRGRRRLRRDLR
jgi:hypothetical protein